ncbi:unnamed protein product, partial [Trichogramma brassicae]
MILPSKCEAVIRKERELDQHQPPDRPVRRRRAGLFGAAITPRPQPRSPSPTIRDNTATDHALQQPAPAAHRHLQLLSRTTPPKKATH